MESNEIIRASEEFILQLSARGLSYLMEEAENREISAVELCQSLLTAVLEAQLADVVLD